MNAVVAAHGIVDERDAALALSADLVVAADGGALHLMRWGVAPAVVVGDMDSLDEATLAGLAARGARIERHPADKDESDLELALARAVELGARRITVLGAFGGRIDYTIANSLLLADGRWAGVDLRAVLGATTVRPLRGPSELRIEAGRGAVVSLLPLGRAAGITTEGLRFPLADGALREGASRGVSNEVIAVPARVRLRDGVLLVVESEGLPESS